MIDAQSGLRSGSPNLEDKTGEIEVVVFSKQYLQFADLLLLETPVVVYGTICARIESSSCNY